MTPILLNDWRGRSFDDVRLRFFPQPFDQDPEYRRWSASGRKLLVEQADFKAMELLLASYTYEGYDGSAFVLFRQDGKLYEVNGSHCSCYGLENQWDPEETTIEALRQRLDKGELGADYNGMNVFATELRALLETL